MYKCVWEVLFLDLLFPIRIVLTYDYCETELDSHIWDCTRFIFILGVQFFIDIKGVIACWGRSYWYLVGASGPSLLADCVVLLGVKRDVMEFNTDCIMLGCICGSSNKSLTVAMLEPSNWLISTCCSIMGLVEVVIRGVLESMVVLLEGPCPWTGILCLWTLFLVLIEFHKSFGSMASTWASNVCERGIRFPHPSNQTRPSEEVW